jgi:hypothetical protein
MLIIAKGEKVAVAVRRITPACHDTAQPSGDFLSSQLCTREAIPGSVFFFHLKEQQYEESALIPIVDSSLGPLGAPEFAGSAATHNLANNPDDHHHDRHGLCYVEVRNKETAEATEARREIGKGPGEGSQAPSGRSQEPSGRQEGTE